MHGAFADQGGEQGFGILAPGPGKGNFDQGLPRIEGAHEGQAIVTFEDKAQIADLGPGQQKMAFFKRFHRR